jgi:hypothetical protein
MRNERFPETESFVHVGATAPLSVFLLPDGAGQSERTGCDCVSMMPVTGK